MIFWETVCAWCVLHIWQTSLTHGRKRRRRKKSSRWKLICGRANIFRSFEEAELPGLQNHPTLLNIYLNMLFFSTNSILYNTLIGVPYYNYGLWHLATLVEEGGKGGKWELKKYLCHPRWALFLSLRCFNSLWRKKGRKKAWIGKKKKHEKLFQIS